MQDEEGMMRKKGERTGENRERLRNKGDVRYSKGTVNGMPIHRSEGSGKKASGGK